MSDQAAETSPSQPTVAPKDNNVVKIPGVQLEIPLGKDVVIRVPGVEQSYRGRMVGYDPYDYLIANVRLPRDVRKDLSFGGQLILKYVHHGAVYGFRTEVHNVISSPAPLIFFAYPDTIEKIDLRQTSRLQCNIDGVLQLQDAEVDCMIINFNESGCKLKAQAGTRDPLQDTKIGDTMLVTMTLGQSGTLKLPIGIRNVSRKKGLIKLGAMFLDIRKDEAEIINRYLEKIEKFSH